MSLEIGGWPHRLEGLDAGLRDLLRERYEAFEGIAKHAGGPESFRFRVLDGQVDDFIPPHGAEPPPVHPLTLGWDAQTLTVRSYGFAGWIDLEDDTGEIALARSGYERPEWALENYLRVVTAWRAVRRGGVLLHGAGVVRADRAYVFIGPSGSGKSTLAGLAVDGRVVSDDLTLIRRIAGEFRVAGTPFRGTHRSGVPVRGTFPVGGIYRIFPASENRLEPAPRETAVLDLLASCPFLVDQLARVPEIFRVLNALCSAHPPGRLHFGLDGGFWDLLPGPL